VSRESAMLALSGEDAGFVSGLSWLPADLLGELAQHSGTSDTAETLAVTAASLDADLAFVEGASASARDAVHALHAADIAAVWCVEGVFGRVATELGWAEALRMTAAEPGALAARLDGALHAALNTLRGAFEAEADAVLVADDLAGPVGPLMSPDFELDALVPCYHRLAVESASGGLPALFHSDGEIRALMPALTRAGFSAVHLAGLDADSFAAAVAAARRSRLVVLGGIRAAALPEGAREAGERAGAVAASPGTMIVCADGGVGTFGQLGSLGAALLEARDAFRRARG
jgi:hypothetical protein